jgi:DNA-directed RNA polymerase subunit K
MIQFHNRGALSMATKTPEITKYEKARLLGARALQLSMGAPIQIKLSKKELEKINYNPIEIAKLELEANKIPIDVIRDIKTE